MDSSVLIVIGVQLTLLGAALVLFGGQIKRRWPEAGAPLVLGRTVALAAGIALIAVPFLSKQTPMSDLANPVANTVQNVEAGGNLYQANCAQCHGADARGGGPDAGLTPVPPPALVEHLADHTDGDLFYWISEGLPRGMPAWKDQLTEDERWQIIVYLRSLVER